MFGTHGPRDRGRGNAAQSAVLREWKSDPRVTVIDPGMTAVGDPASTVVDLHSARFRESGGDAAAQRLLTEWTDDRVTDAAILLSADADHQATVSGIRRRRRTHLELARWEWQASSLWGDKLWTHHLDTHILDAVTRDRDPRKAA